MIRKITVTEGLFSEELISVDFIPSPEDFQAISDAIEDDRQKRVSPVRRELKEKELLGLLQAARIESPNTNWKNATRWLEWLEKVEALPRSSLERLALDWLEEYKFLKFCQERMALQGYDVDLFNEAIFRAENLTRLEMWIFWKSEKEPKSGRSREDLGLTGQKMSLTAKDNRERKRSKHRLEREARFGRMRELIPQMGVDKAAAHVSSEGLGTTSAIKKQWTLAVLRGEERRLRRIKGTQP